MTDIPDPREDALAAYKRRHAANAEAFWSTMARAALRIAIPWVREQALREAAQRAAEFTEPRILAMWSRPGGPPPGNGWIPLTGKHVADAILALIPTPPKETPDDN